MNAEPPLSHLGAAFVTPQSDLYIRTHGEMQHIAETDYRLRLGRRVAREFEFSVTELRECFAPRTVTATLQCAGNRRADLQEVAKTAGDPCAAGAVGNVRWTGVALREVLEPAGAENGDGQACAAPSG